MTSDSSRCPGTTTGGGMERRTLRCQGKPLHEGQCWYWRRGGQGGSTTRWWGANPRPVEFLSDLSEVQLIGEVHRLRSLCDTHGIDWRFGLLKVATHD